MPTLSYEGSVYLSSAVDRWELVVIAPSYEVDVLLNRVQTALALGETHTISFTDLPENKVTGVLLSVSEGDVDVVITDDDSVAATFNVTTSGMLILMNTLVTALTITASVDSVYDLIMSGTVAGA